ncbi:enoyl-CoA hydratase, putative [Hepatocystis sp. ex Piliocolobus tephrosceles]|nr:enoyl-CoA hydratase, putative [Hepatocystis sp. ex Piliocolobus tephrosceles]
MLVRKFFFLSGVVNKRIFHTTIKKRGSICSSFNYIRRFKMDISEKGKVVNSNGESSNSDSSSDKSNGNEKTEKEEKEENITFSNHKYVDFFRDETRNIGIITFKNINTKKNIFQEFLEEFKNVIEHINNIITNEESKISHYIKEFKNTDNYLVKNIKNNIPYYDSKLKVLIINSSLIKQTGVTDVNQVSDNSNEKNNSTTESNNNNGTDSTDIFLNSLDYNSYLKNDEQMNIHISNMFRMLCNNVQNLPVITISNINGLCYNCGMDVLFSSDFCISSEKSRFGFDKTYIGLYPYGGSIQKIFRQISMKYSKFLLLTSQAINAQDALKMNLIDICLKTNEHFYIKNSNVSFDQIKTNEQKFTIIKKEIIKYFHDIFLYNLFKNKINDDSFIFTLFFAYQFLFIPTHILQNIKSSINEGTTMSDANAYLECDRNFFEKTINSVERLDILEYIKRSKK